MESFVLDKWLRVLRTDQFYTCITCPRDLEAHQRASTNRLLMSVVAELIASVFENDRYNIGIQNMPKFKPLSTEW